MTTYKFQLKRLFFLKNIFKTDLNSNSRHTSLSKVSTQVTKEVQCQVDRNILTFNVLESEHNLKDQVDNDDAKISTDM